MGNPFEQRIFIGLRHERGIDPDQAGHGAIAVCSLWSAQGGRMDTWAILQSLVKLTLANTAPLVAT
jgi:hypothetical protein